MCCPKRFDTKPWAFACAYVTLLMYFGTFLLFIPFVFHPNIFDPYVSMMGDTHPVYAQVALMGKTFYGLICFLCFGALFVAFLSLLCIIGIHKERSGFLIPYLVVKSLITLVVVGGSFFAFHFLRLVDESATFQPNGAMPAEQAQELWMAGKSTIVLFILFTYWLFITPIVIVSTHCHRIIHGTTAGYVGAPLIAMEVPPAQDMPVYHYEVKSAGAV